MSVKYAITVAVAVGAFVASRPANAACGCSGNPGTITSDGSGACLKYPAPSGAAYDITYRFDKSYACGRFANGDYFAVVDAGGHVVVSDLSPAVSAGHNGAAVNPSGASASQPWDKNIPNYAAPTLTFPYSAAAGDSIVKYASNPNCDGPSHSCGRFSAVLTVLAAPPAQPADTFRPPFVGRYKPTFLVSQLQRQILGRLDGAAVPDKYSRATAERLTKNLRLEYTSSSVSCDHIVADDSTNGPTGSHAWSTDIWADDTGVAFWLNLKDVCAAPPCTAQQDDDAKLPALIGLVQQGIDLWAGNKMGTSFERGGGGNGGGILFRYAFAATLLAAPEMLKDLGAIKPDDFFESESYYRGKASSGGAAPALWGQRTGTEQEYWDELKNPANASSKTIRDPYGFIDGGRYPGNDYQFNTSKPTVYTALLLSLVPSLKKNWPINGDVLVDYATRWMTKKTLTLPDPCAPANGTYGVDYGSDGKGGCIRGAGRVPELDGKADTIFQTGADRTTPFGDEMWSAFNKCALTCSCPGQVCTIASPGAGGAGGDGSQQDAGNGSGAGDANGRGASGGGSGSSGGGCNTGDAGRAPWGGSAFVVLVLGAMTLRRRVRPAN